MNSQHETTILNNIDLKFIRIEKYNALTNKNRKVNFQYYIFDTKLNETLVKYKKENKLQYYPFFNNNKSQLKVKENVNFVDDINNYKNDDDIIKTTLILKTFSINKNNTFNHIQNFDTKGNFNGVYFQILKNKQNEAFNILYNEQKILNLDCILLILNYL